jgi:hypothetical protein
MYDDNTCWWRLYFSSKKINHRGGLLHALILCLRSQDSIVPRPDSISEPNVRSICVERQNPLNILGLSFVTAWWHLFLFWRFTSYHPGARPQFKFFFFNNESTGILFASFSLGLIYCPCLWRELPLEQIWIKSARPQPPVAFLAPTTSFICPCLICPSLPCISERIGWYNCSRRYRLLKYECSIFLCSKNVVHV